MNVAISAAAIVVAAGIGAAIGHDPVSGALAGGFLTFGLLPGVLLSRERAGHVDPRMQLRAMARHASNRHRSLGPVEPTLEDLGGWKAAALWIADDGTQARLGGLTIGSGELYAAEADAVCVHAAEHPELVHVIHPEVVDGGDLVVPGRSCSCGFHAWTNRERARALVVLSSARASARVLVQVEAFGTVIVCERGIRYSSQTVLGVHADDRCCACRLSGGHGRARWVGARLTGQSSVSLDAKGRRWVPAFGICDDHVADFGDGDVALRANEVTGMLGTTFTFTNLIP